MSYRFYRCLIHDLQPVIERKNIAVYMPTLVAHVPVEHGCVERLKREIVERGGKRNLSARFINPNEPGKNIVRMQRGNTISI